MVIESRKDHARIEAAIAAAEAKTGVHILLVSVPQAGHYGAFALIHALTAGLIAAAVPMLALPHPDAAIVTAIQAGVILIALLCLQNRWLRLKLVPKAILHKAASRQARLVYARAKLKATAGAPLLLLFCARAERHAEILAEERILAMAPEPVWRRIHAGFIPAMRGGDSAGAFVHLIERSADALAPHFPKPA